MRAIIDRRDSPLRDHARPEIRVAFVGGSCRLFFMRTQTKRTEPPQETVALGDFTADIQGVLQRLRESGQPLVVTENGEPAMVIVTPDEFHSLRYREQFVSAILSGLEDVKAGRVVTDDEFGAELDAEFGPLA